MFAVSTRHTEAGAKRIASERRATPRRDALAAASLEWASRQAAKKEAEDQRKARMDALAIERRALIKLDRPPGHAIRAMIDLVARMHGATYDEVMSKSRRHRVVMARQAAMCAVAYKRPDYSLPMLGRIFKRDHTTVLYALRVRGLR
ncbi:MAG: hypothetical protein KAY22_23790 [Rhizorhabdus sp.]|uniref:helix-turn-helix domain-containing protein n=1 Tax=Rhizorhabdus sp. TaxID=1968843 RepID=UPI001B7A375D|nr:helix-turn-helix domain-containing protein [Rhizorhabdus sp.]MBP8235322.1 hypothetical protein [Rhizorhabdus sp.]